LQHLEELLVMEQQIQDNRIGNYAENPLFRSRAWKLPPAQNMQRKGFLVGSLLEVAVDPICSGRPAS
jgi:hypothetical protein